MGGGITGGGIIGGIAAGVRPEAEVPVVTFLRMRAIFAFVGAPDVAVFAGVLTLTVVATGLVVVGAGFVADLAGAGPPSLIVPPLFRAAASCAVVNPAGVVFFICLVFSVDTQSMMTSGKVFVFKSHYDQVFSYSCYYNIYNGFVKLYVLC